MGLFNRKKEPQEQTIIQTRTNDYNIQPGEDLSRLRQVGWTQDGEPIFKWAMPDTIDKRIILEKEN